MRTRNITGFRKAGLSAVGGSRALTLGSLTSPNGCSRNWWLRKAEIRVVREYLPDAVKRAGREIRSVHFRSLAGGAPMRVSARVFIDATYESDMSPLSPACRIASDEKTAANTTKSMPGKFGSSAAGTKPISPTAATKPCNGLGQRGAAISISAPGGEPPKKSFPRARGKVTAAVQAANFRVCLSSDPDNQIPVEPPEGL